MARVYLLSNNDLFGQGVMNLLRLESDIEIVGQGIEADQAIEDINRLTPDVVIVESSDPTQDSALTVMRILKTKTTVEVICLDLTENQFHLYHGEQRDAGDVRDLVDAIKTELSINRPNV